MYYYKARIYSPRLGRFLQVDPIGYEDQYNLYAYVANDPINAIDPTGMRCLRLCPIRPIPLPGTSPAPTDDLNGNGVHDAEDIARDLKGGIESFPAKADRALQDNSIIYRELIRPLFNEASDTPLETDEVGKVKGNVDVGGLGEGELEGAAEQLDESIKRRRSENSQHPRGNPNGTEAEREQNKRYRGHKERIRREEEWRQQIQDRIDSWLK